MTVRTLSALSRPDYLVMRGLNRWSAPGWFRWWMLLATRAGDGWLWGMLGIAILCSSAPSRFEALGAGLLAVGSGTLIFRYLKRVVCRTRPRDIEPNCWAPVATCDRFSFPSGHSTTAFAVALSLGSFYPEIMPLLLVLAANVAVSRVFVGMHFLSDVIAGSGMGALLGYAAYRLVA
jgi:undecaprenyl-diphosphatase